VALRDTSQGDKASPATTVGTQDANAIFSYFLQIAMLPHSGPLRMTTRSILDVLADDFPDLKKATSDAVISKIVSGLSSSHKNGNPMDVIRVIQAIVSFDFTRDVLVRTIQGSSPAVAWCFDFCARLLTATSAPFVTYDGKCHTYCRATCRDHVSMQETVYLTLK
jgi:hypothetical protein